MTAFRTPAVASRLPKVGTTIFTVMSALAAEHRAVNLGQGFPDFEGDPALVDAVAQAMRATTPSHCRLTSLEIFSFCIEISE